MSDVDAFVTRDATTYISYTGTPLYVALVGMVSYEPQTRYYDEFHLEYGRVGWHGGDG